MPSYLRDRIEQWWRSLDHGQQISLSFFAPCAVLALVLSVVSLRLSITMPFRAPKALLENSQAVLVRQRAVSDARLASEAIKDTDGDGILDQDETAVFRTSAYLADTDSDGIPDGEEVRVGTDPNCPPDRDCYGFAEMSPDAVPDAQEDSSDVVTSAHTSVIEPPRPPDEISPSDIRAYLIRTGLATAEQVTALPDQGVVELYRRAYSELRKVNNAQVGGSTSTTVQSSPSTSP